MIKLFSKYSYLFDPQVQSSKLASITISSAHMFMLLCLYASCCLYVVMSLLSPSETVSTAESTYRLGCLRLVYIVLLTC